MPAIIQNNRSVKVYTALDENELLFSSMSGGEHLSRLFNYQLEMVSENHHIRPIDLLGTGITVELVLYNGQSRYFHGFVSSCLQVAGPDDLACYEVTLKPWFWFLSRTSDCRIFQEMTVPDIIMQIFGDEGFTDVENTLTDNYATWDFCVQYRETDYNFISRLMEQEGIYYYFKHERGLHKLVLCDGISAHAPMPGYESVPFYPPGNDIRRERDNLSRWDMLSQVEPGRFVYKDFNFKSPKANLLVRSDAAAEHAMSNYEIYEYPGEYINRDQGEAAIRKRREESQAQHEVANGSGNAQGLSTGNLFTLSNLPQDDLNQEYLITQSDISLHLDDYSSGGDSEVDVHCNIAAIRSNKSFRAPRVTPKPIVQGPQTAFVVGPAGNEIWTDEHGRVKLQFHWDRYGTADENSSCWVRVSQVWAGQGWGAMHIPRIGHEVIVEFLEGDPDRPIITGRVYNADNGVPYGLPGNATQSGIKSRSSAGGSAANYNEIRMEDKKGSEELYIHAEKNQNNVVENNETTSVGHDRTETVGNDENISIGNDRQESVGNNETVTIGGDRSVTIGANKMETVQANKTETIAVAKNLNIGAAYTVAVAADVKETFKANQTTGIAGNNQKTVDGNQSITVNKSQQVSIGNDQNTSVGEDQGISIGKKLMLDVGDQITIKTGKASITMKKDGSIEISGKDITIKGSGNINTKASKNIVSKAKKILQN